MQQLDWQRCKGTVGEEEVKWERRKGSCKGKQDCELMEKRALVQWRLKSCVRCSLEHLRRDFPGYNDRENRKVFS